MVEILIAPRYGTHGARRRHVTPHLTSHGKAGLHETCQNEAITSMSIRGDVKKKKKKRSFSSSSLAARECQEALVQ